MKPAPSRTAVPAALLLAVLALLGAGAAVARADEEPPLPPPNTAPFTGYPPYKPNEVPDDATASAWCEAAIAAGRAAPGTRRGGDLLASAADVLDRRLGLPVEAAGVFGEARGAYPSGDPGIGLLLLTWADSASRRGHSAQVGRLLEQLAPWRSARRPRDLDVAAGRRWNLLEDALLVRLPRIEALWLERNGRFLDAATRLVDLARTEVPGRDPSVAARLWERAARLRYRGGAREAALAAIDEAIALREVDDTALASLRFWKLQARHGLLDAEAAPVMTARWPGADYDRDVKVYLRSIQGTEGITTRYLTLASSALQAGRHETAVDIYELAMRDPTVLEAARHAPLVWRGLLPAYKAALALGRYDQAERILERIERIADEPLPEKDDYLLAIRKAREAGRRKAAPPRETPPVPPTEAPTDPGPRQGIETGEAAPSEPALPPDDPAPDPAPLWPWLLAVGVLAVGLILWRRR